jgi:hypothetical protein
VDAATSVTATMPGGGDFGDCAYLATAGRGLEGFVRAELATASASAAAAPPTSVGPSQGPLVRAGVAAPDGAEAAGEGSPGSQEGKVFFYTLRCTRRPIPRQVLVAASDCELLPHVADRLSSSTGSRRCVPPSDCWRWCTAARHWSGHPTPWQSRRPAWRWGLRALTRLRRKNAAAKETLQRKPPRSWLPQWLSEKFQWSGGCMRRSCGLRTHPWAMHRGPMRYLARRLVPMRAGSVSV